MTPDDRPQPKTDPKDTRKANEALKARARDDSERSSDEASELERHPARPGTAGLVRGYGDLAREREAELMAEERSKEQAENDERSRD